MCNVSHRRAEHQPIRGGRQPVTEPNQDERFVVDVTLDPGRAGPPNGTRWVSPREDCAGFVCGLEGAACLHWIDVHGLHSSADDNASIVIALITEAIRLGDKRWLPLAGSSADAAITEANATRETCNAVLEDVRTVLGVSKGEGIHAAIRVLAGGHDEMRRIFGTAKESDLVAQVRELDRRCHVASYAEGSLFDRVDAMVRAIREWARILGVPEGDRIGDHLRDIDDALSQAPGASLRQRARNTRDAELLLSKKCEKQYNEVVGAARLLSDAGFAGATLYDRIVTVLREHERLTAEREPWSKSRADQFEQEIHEIRAELGADSDESAIYALRAELGRRDSDTDAARRELTALKMERDAVMTKLHALSGSSIVERVDKLSEHWCSAAQGRSAAEAKVVALTTANSKLLRAASDREAAIRDALENNVGSPARAVLLAGMALYQPILGGGE